MASKIDICNFALQNIGANKITSLNEGTTEAIECNFRYDSARRALLQMCPWNFATKRVNLSADVNTPAFGYAYQYTLPSDFLYLVMTSLEERHQAPAAKVYNSNFYVSDVPTAATIDKYRIEGNRLLTHDTSVGIVYVADETDTQLYSATFTELLARLLSVMISYRVTGSKTERDAQYQIFQQELELAQSIDGQQGVFDRIEISEFLSARL